MKRPIRNVALLFIATFFGIAVHAEIIKVKGDRVLIRLAGKTVSVGEQLDVINASGQRTAIVEVTSFDQTKAIAKIESGYASAGMKLARRSSTIERKSFYNYDFRLNPIGLVAGAIAANFDFRITQNLTIGPEGTYLRVKLNPTGIFNSDYNITAYGYGVRANWFFNGAFKEGFYLGPSLEYLNVNIQTTDLFGPAKGIADGLMASLLIGYGWFWDNFNLLLGGGYGAVLGKSSITIKDTAGNQETITANLSGLTYELSVGWAF